MIGILGILMGIVGFLGSAYYGVSVLMNLGTIFENKMSGNQNDQLTQTTQSYHKRDAKKSLKMLIIYFAIFAFGILIAYISMNDSKL